MAQKTHVVQGQDHSSRSSMKVAEISHCDAFAILLSKYKKFDAPAIAGFCSSIVQFHVQSDNNRPTDFLQK